ncbi:hypothetical protein [Actinopolymorpha rutila]|uniref:Uncharacterized protein n=1 Tax=Actinopolymorpha rutila TaxID=446787 RepID=A0A852ZNU9_9ACTN|nr:hypothetical protein [Actinopolymorpha rutila]NYH93222.1 hypothetical protein [Actinopolymorpha rutila]
MTGPRLVMIEGVAPGIGNPEFAEVTQGFRDKDDLVPLVLFLDGDVREATGWVVIDLDATAPAEDVLGQALAALGLPRSA